MSLFGALFGGKSRQLKDPVFGVLKDNGTLWNGLVEWPEHEVHMALNVHRAGTPPDESDHRLYQQLRADYRLLRTPLQAALLQLWTQACRDHELTDVPPVGSSLDLWKRLQLQGLSLYPDGHAQMLFGFDDEAFGDGALVVGIRDGEVSADEYIA